MKFLWSAHPLLRVEAGTEIILPKEVKEMEVAGPRSSAWGSQATYAHGRRPGTFWSNGQAQSDGFPECRHG